MEVIPIRFEAFSTRLEAIPVRLEAISIRLEAIPIGRRPSLLWGGHPYWLLGCCLTCSYCY